MNNMGITESNIIKARSGRYKDTEENRRLHRVGQQYGEKKEKVENDDNVFLKYDLQSLKDASEKMSDKINELENQLKQVSDESDKKELMEDLSKLKESSAKVLSAISQKEKQGVKFLRGKDVGKRRKDQIETTGGAAKEVDLSGWDNETLTQAIDDSIQTLEIYRTDLENATTDEERNTLINRIEKQEKRLRSYQEELGKRGDKYSKQEEKYNEVKRFMNSEEGAATVSKILNELKELPVGAVISIDSKEISKYGEGYWISNGSIIRDGHIVQKVLMSKDGDFLIESLPMDYIKEQEKKHEETKKKAEKQGRVYLGEAPNSAKVNLAKYLSAKAKENIDRILGQVIPTKSRAELATMYDDAVKNFNEGFDGMKKAARANMLYQILTILAALDNKQGDEADIPLASNMSKEEFADYIASERGAARKAEMEAKMEQIRAEHEQKLNALEEEATKAYKTSGVDKVYVGDGAMDMYWEGGGSLAIQGPSKWRPDQDFTVRVPGVGSVYFNSEQARVFSLAGELLTNTKMKKQALDFLKKFQDIIANTSKMQKETLTQYPDFSSDGSGVRIE